VPECSASDGIEQGAYHYQRNGEAQAITEYWERRLLASGETLMVSSRSVPGLDIRVEARLSEGLVTRCELQWLAQGQEALVSSYSIRGNHLVVTRSDGPRALAGEDVEFDASAAAPLLSPLLRVYTGPVISRLLETGGVGQVVVPFIGDVSERQRLLRPQVSERRARVLEEGVSLRLAGGDFPCRLCEYQGDQYGPGTRFWLAEDALLLRYQWQQAPDQLWDVWLERSGKLN
jgi:hypothetical protein